MGAASDDPEAAILVQRPRGRVGLGNLSRRSRPLTYVHNPLAQVPLATSWGVWDREFVITPRGDEWEANDILAQAAAEAS